MNIVKKKQEIFSRLCLRDIDIYELHRILVKQTHGTRAIHWKAAIMRKDCLIIYDEDR